MDVSIVRPSKSLRENLEDFLYGVSVTALRTWFAMLLIGVVHHDIWAAVPPIGYWHTLALLYLIGILRSSDEYRLWTSGGAK